MKPKKKTIKQEINMLKTKLKRAESNYVKLRTKKVMAAKLSDDAWKETDNIRLKIAIKASPFKKGQIIKHYNGKYVKVTKIEDCSPFKEPFCIVFGKRIKSDLKTLVDKESKKLDIACYSALEVISTT